MGRKVCPGRRVSIGGGHNFTAIDGRGWKHILRLLSVYRLAEWRYLTRREKERPAKRKVSEETETTVAQDTTPITVDIPRGRSYRVRREALGRCSVATGRAVRIDRREPTKGKASKLHEVAELIKDNERKNNHYHQ